LLTGDRSRDLFGATVDVGVDGVEYRGEKLDGFFGADPKQLGTDNRAGGASHYRAS